MDEIKRRVAFILEKWERKREAVLLLNLDVSAR